MMNGAYMDDHKIMLMKGLDQTPDFVEVAFLMIFKYVRLKRTA